MKKLLFFIAILFFGAAAAAQENPVKWTFETKKTAEGEYDLLMKANAEPGWYVYSQFLEDGGPIPTSFIFKNNPNIELAGKIKEDGHRHEAHDEMFDMVLVKFSERSVFTQHIKLKAATTVNGTLEFMTCNNEKCLPPRQVDFKFTLQ